VDEKNRRAATGNCCIRLAGVGLDPHRMQSLVTNPTTGGYLGERADGPRQVPVFTEGYSHGIRDKLAEFNPQRLNRPNRATVGFHARHVQLAGAHPLPGDARAQAPCVVQGCRQDPGPGV
jgi:hypothetical protein